MSDYDTEFDRKAESAKAKSLRFLRYLSTRKIECWGFFVAGYLIATIF